MCVFEHHQRGLELRATPSASKDEVVKRAELAAIEGCLPLGKLGVSARWGNRTFAVRLEQRTVLMEH